MRKVTWGFAIGIAVLFVVIGAVMLMSRSNRTTMMQAPPLTVADVERLSVPSSEANADTGGNRDAGDEQAPPHALVRALTEAEMQDHIGQGGTAGRSAAANAKLALCDGLATAFGIAGIDNERGGWYWEAGQEAEALGDIELAKAYYREALNHPTFDYVREWCLARLAWYEDDAEVASTLLERSCASDHPSWLRNAVQIAHITGSTDARDYYLDRLRTAEPQLAALVAEELGISELKGKE